MFLYVTSNGLNTAITNTVKVVNCLFIWGVNLSDIIFVQPQFQKNVGTLFKMTIT